MFSEISEPGIEGLFLQEVRAHNEYHRYGYELFFWRTTSNTEVDLVLYGARGLKAFGTDYPSAQLYVIYMGTKTEYHGRIPVIPFDWALTHMQELIS